MNDNFTNVRDRDTSVTVPQKNLEGARYVFTVANLISDNDKATNPDWRVLGGVIRPGSQCLKYQSGYIPRCEITELRQQADSTTASNVHPEKREGAIKFYETAAVNSKTGVFEQKQIGINPDGTHDGLLRKFFYPAQEIGQIAGQIDGVVEMPVSNNREKNLAQYFLFPQWDAIKQGLAPMPPTVQILKAHFLKLKSGLTPDNPHFSLFTRVVNAALKSCDDFIAWGNRKINEANAQLATAKTKGWAWSYGDEAILLFQQLGLPRQDMVAQESAAQIGQLVEASTKQAETMDKFLQFQMNQAQGQNASVQPIAEVPKQNTTGANNESLGTFYQGVSTSPVAQSSASDEVEKDAPDDEAEMTDAPKFVVGAHVIANEREAEIIAVNPGGNLKIQYIDGLKETAGVNRKNCTLV